MIFWHTLFIGTTCLIVGKGVVEGIGKTINFLMPTLFFLIVLLCIYSSFTVSTQSNRSQQVFILGTKKSIIIENPFNAEPKKSTNIVIYNGNSIYRKDNTIKTFPPIDQYEVQVTAFSDHLLKKTKVDYDLVDAKKNMKVLDAIFKSSKKGSWIKV